MVAELRGDVDPDLSFFSARDHVLFDASWPTFPGRMAAYCPHDDQDYRTSLYELPEDLPDATRYWGRWIHSRESSPAAGQRIG
jgi:hypothetical protein